MPVEKFRYVEIDNAMADWYDRDGRPMEGSRRWMYEWESHAVNDENRFKQH